MWTKIQSELGRLKDEKNTKLDFTSPKELEMKRVSNDVAIRFISENHYSKTCPRNIKLALGFFYKDILTTVIVYGVSINSNLPVSIWSEGDFDKCWELVRLYSHDNCIRNTESYCIGQSFKYIKQHHPNVEVLVSYADSKQTHLGYIYQATNWLYIGLGGDSQEIYFNDQLVHTRTIVAKFGGCSNKRLQEQFQDGITQRKALPKYKYIYILKNKKEIMKNKKFEILPYPKKHLDSTTWKTKKGLRYISESQGDDNDKT